MPIYEYECEKCGCHREVMQKFSDPPLSTCDQCKGPMKKLVSQSAFHLKGTGWYVTDYARKSSSETSGGSAEKKESSAKTSEAKDTTSTAADKKD